MRGFAVFGDILRGVSVSNRPLRPPQNHTVFVAFKNFSGRLCVGFAFSSLVNIIFVFINEIQTDGGRPPVAGFY